MFDEALEAVMLVIYRSYDDKIPARCSEISHRGHQSVRTEDVDTAEGSGKYRIY